MALNGLAAQWTCSVRSLGQATVTRHVSVRGFQVEIPFERKVRLSIVAGNIRVHRLIDASTGLGDSVVDVGAHIGLNTVYMAARVGPAGHVTAIEPALDNLAVLRANVAANNLENVTVCAVAAGRSHERRNFFVRGDVSAVGSLFADSFYAPVTDIAPVTVAPLDDLVAESPRLVKIDVEGGELDVLDGMARILVRPDIRLIVEWHPVLQEAAGYPADALPRSLWQRGFGLRAASHYGVTRLTPQGLDPLIGRLRRHRRPVELWAQR